MNSKLFKKLNEQVEINQLKRNSEVDTLTESEKAQLESNIIFNNVNAKRVDTLNFRDDVK